MKAFNITIIIATLFTLPFASAKPTKTKKTAQKTISIPTPPKAPALPAQDEAYRKGAAALPAKTYKQLHNDIKIMKADQVIKNDLLTDYFITFVKDNAQKSALANALTQELLQTGMYLYAPFSGNNEKDAQLLSAVNQQIANIMSQLKKPTPQELEKIRPVPTAPTKAIPAPAKQEKKQPEPITPPQSKQTHTQPTLPEPKKGLSEPRVQAKRPSQEATVEKPVEQKQPSEPVTVPQNKEGQGIAALQNFRKATAAKPMSSFYANAKVNEQWLINGLQLVLNGAQLSAQNKAQMQGELVGNATELMREFLEKNKIDPQLHKTFLDNVKTQTINFINKQLPNQQLTQKLPAPKTPSQQPASPEPKKAVADAAAKPSTQKEEGVALQLPTWISAKDNTFIAKEFEIELLAYIFKHQDATNNEIITYFSQQVPSQLPTKNNLIKNIETTVKNTSPAEPIAKPTPLHHPKYQKKTCQCGLIQKKSTFTLQALSMQ